MLDWRRFRYECFNTISMTDDLSLRSTAIFAKISGLMAQPRKRGDFMEHPSGRKLFSAERQRLKAMGSVVAVPARQGQDSEEILSAIAALQNDLRGLTDAVRHQSGAVPHVMTEHDAHGSSSEVKLLRNEIRAMSLAIQQTKSEIAALRPPNTADDRLMVVTQELDAIVTATERATNSILESAERVDLLAEQVQSLGSDTTSQQLAGDIRDTVITMFEACNFQDITGQRISKVVKTLQFIEERINRMIDIWGPEAFDEIEHSQEELDEEAKLLNGPQLANQGVSQADIDKLFD
jgi:chemotaxis protein CheZ